MGSIMNSRGGGSVNVNILPKKSLFYILEKVNRKLRAKSVKTVFCSYRSYYTSTNIAHRILVTCSFPMITYNSVKGNVFHH
jgi:hypothetical protein